MTIASQGSSMATTVADGLTKQLLGQSFDRFRADLGLVSKITNKEKVVTTSMAMTPGAAIKVLTVGSVLMQHAKAMSNATAMESEDLTTLWTTSIILMVMGAIYVLQLLAKGAKCCLRRLWASGSLANGESSETAATSLRQEAVSEGEASVSSEISAPERRRRVFRDDMVDGAAQSLRTRSGSHGAAASSMDVSATTTLQSASPSGSVASLTLRSSPQSGSAGSVAQQSTSQSGSAASVARQSASQSGFADACASTLSMPRRSGLAMVDESDRVAVEGETFEPRSVERVFSKAAPSYNRWNEFQHANRSKGWGTEKMRTEYYKAKCQGRT